MMPRLLTLRSLALWALAVPLWWLGEKLQLAGAELDRQSIRDAIAANDLRAKRVGCRHPVHYRGSVL